VVTSFPLSSSIALPNGRVAVAVRTSEKASVERVVQALQLPQPKGVFVAFWGGQG
jgi:hypothetical protein